MRLLAMILVVCLSVAAVPVRAATTGIAYDLVAKSGIGLDPFTYTPAVFEADARAALNQVSRREIVDASAARTPQSIAFRLYITPSKQRGDYPLSNTAAIVDCDAGTVTMLDFGAKTYVVLSLDALGEFPSAAFPGPEKPKTEASDYSLTIDTRALGSKRMEDIDAEGYESTERYSSPVSTGTATSTTVTTTYYSNTAVPTSRCARAMRSSRFDPKYDNASNPHIKITGLQSVPGRLPLLTTISSTMTLPNPAHNFMTGNETLNIVETGHIRRISSGDPIFAIPSGFRPAGSADQVAAHPHARTSATVGVAYDQVTKLAVPVQPPTLTVASFDADFQAVARPIAGFDITHVYITTSKGRKDSIAMGYAWIVDCEARTVTTLNLAKKTYSVKSLATARAEIAGSLDFSGLKSKAVSRALGTRRLGDISVPAYETTTTQTIEIPGGLPTSMESVVDSYFSGVARAHLSCSDEAVVYAPEADFLAQFSNVEKSGVELPDRLALFTTMRLTRAFAGVVGGAGGQVATEIGHIRPISSDDAIFGVPPDFKPE